MRGGGFQSAYHEYAGVDFDRCRTDLRIAVRSAPDGHGCRPERAAPVGWVSGGGGQAQGEATTQLVSSFQDVALSQVLEPPLLAR